MSRLIKKPASEYIRRKGLYLFIFLSRCLAGTELISTAMPSLIKKPGRYKMPCPQCFVSAVQSSNPMDWTSLTKYSLEFPSQKPVFESHPKQSIPFWSFKLNRNWVSWLWKMSKYEGKFLCQKPPPLPHVFFEKGIIKKKGPTDQKKAPFCALLQS